jgi:guanylate kinase
MKKQKGKLFVIAAPSGAGKTSLVRALLEQRPELRFSISYTTRKPRPKEKHGEDYFFVDHAAFEKMVADGKFLEHAKVFDNYYGTAKEQVETILNNGEHVILEIDWQGAQQIRQAMPECHSIFILPPSRDELERRLRGRGTDNDEVIARRLRDSVSDMKHWDEFDYVVINDDFEHALSSLANIIDEKGEGFQSARPELIGITRGLIGRQ